MSGHDDIWGYSYERIRAYLLDAGAAEAEAGRFTLGGCKVALQALPERQMGTLAFPQTRVRMEGAGSDAVYHQFRLHFLSGGA